MGHISRLLRAADEVACRLLKQRLVASCMAVSDLEAGSLLTSPVEPHVRKPTYTTGELQQPSASAKALLVASGAEGSWAASRRLIEPLSFGVDARLISHSCLYGANMLRMLPDQAESIALTRWQHPAFARGLSRGSFSPLVPVHSPRPYSTGNRTSDMDQNEGEADGAEGDGEFWDGDVDDAGSLYETIITEVVDEGRVGLITINRPDVLNALSSQVMDELEDALEEYDGDPRIKAIILTGSGKKAFAAGADIKEMRDQEFVSAYLGRLLSGYEKAVSACRTPIIAAVNGYALGGGCELAMMCDVILAGENAVFGQPETTLGVIPGMGGTQRLIRAVGKSRAMEMILSGSHFIDADEAVSRGLASRVVPGGADKLVDAAIDLAKQIARLSAPVVAMAKEAVNTANDLGLAEGVKKESILFSACFGLHDQKEGMTAFLEKRKARFQDR